MQISTKITRELAFLQRMYENVCFLISQNHIFCSKELTSKEFPAIVYTVEMLISQHLTEKRGSYDSTI